MDWSHAVRMMLALFCFLIWSPIATCNIYYGYRRYRDPKTEIARPLFIIGSIFGIAMVLIPPYINVFVRLSLVALVVLMSDGSWYLGETMGRQTPAALKP